jgi:ribosomal protein S18 acetylase RimI-like enzyme
VTAGHGPGERAAADVVVRPATAEDFDAWLQVFEAVAAEGKWIGSELPFDRDARRRGYDQTLADEHATSLLAVDPATDAVVGQLFIGVASYGVADLGMAILDGWRGRGVGSALMAAAVDFARDHGAHKVNLQVWPHNAAALALYEKFGFEVEGRLHRHWPRRNGELWDALVMGLVLDDARPGSPHDG